MDMKKIEHSLFSFEVPEGFDQQLLSETIALVRSSNIPYKVQPPFVRWNLEELEDLDRDEITGNTLAEKVVHYYLAEDSQGDRSEVQELSVNGFRTLGLSAKISSVVLEKEYHLHYLFAAVLLDEVHFISFLGVHEITADGTMQDWMMEVLYSLEVLGDTQLRAKALSDYDKRLNRLLGDRPQKKEAPKEAERPTDIAIPKNGTEYFSVGDFSFEFVPEATEMHITTFSRELLITIKAKTKKVKQGIAAKVLDDYPGDGAVTITIPAVGIHKNGVPTGSLFFEDGKTNAPLFLNAKIEGFDYRIDLNGTLILKEGWVLLEGEMTKSYHDHSFPIRLYKKFDVEGLDWKHYRFTSIAETRSVNKEDVRFLQLRDPNLTVFPEEILEFKNLEELIIVNKMQNWDGEKSPFSNIPEDIGNLDKLKKLQINGAAIKKLPEGIGALKNLEQLSINNCLLRTLPDSVWQLPKLAYMSFFKNDIDRIPENIDLPLVGNILLDHNKLTSVPASLALQPKLRRVNLEHNPLETLPEAFNAISEVTLSMEDKKRLLDYEYKGADGKGTVAWDDTIYWSENDASLLPRIDAVLTENDLEEYKVALRAIVKKSIGFRHVAEETYEKVGNHRFGGMPDLPKSMPYPRFGENWREDKDDYVYEFIAQINCGEIAHLQEYLPRTGTLFFFLETIHSIYGGRNAPAKVVHVQNNDELASGKRFQFTEDDYSEMVDGGYQGYTVSAEKMNSAPSFYASHVNEHLFRRGAEKLKEDDDLLESLYDTFEAPINGKDQYEYEVNGHGFTQNEAPELQASLVLKGNPEDWMVLLTVTSAGDMQWSDAGDLFFVIHKSDLAKGDFSNIFVTVESS